MSANSNQVGAWLALPLVVATCTVAAAAQDPPVLRRYDLRGLGAGVPDPIPAWRRTPTEAFDTASGGARDDALYPVDLDWLVGFLQDELALDSADGHVGIERPDPGILLVTAAPQTHERLAALLAQCRAWLLEQVVVEVHLLPGAAIAGGNGLLGRAEAERLLADAGAHPLFVRTATVGAPQLLQANDDQRYLRDYDTEVAQGSQIPDPKIDVLHGGSGFRVQLAHGHDGRLLTTVFGALAAPDGPPVVRPLRSVSIKGAQETSLVQLPRLFVQEQGTQALLGDGDALLFGGSGGTDTAWCVRVRRPHAVAAPAGDGWSMLPVADLVGTFGPKPTRSGWIALPGRGEEQRFESWSDELEAPAASRHLGALDLIAGLRPALGGEVGRSLQAAKDVVLVRAPAAEQAAVRARLRELVADGAGQVTVELRHGRLDDKDVPVWLDARADFGELAGRLPERCLTASLLDGWFGLSAGREHSIVRDFEVEIAQEAGTPNPVIEPVFAGIALGGRVVPVARAEYRLELEFRYAELGGAIELFDFKNERFGDVDLPKVRSVSLYASPIVADNRWTLLQIAPLPGTGQHLAVVARVRDDGGR